jgi:hypothetical protein
VSQLAFSFEPRKRRERLEVIPALTYVGYSIGMAELWREAPAGDVDRESDMAIQWMLGIAACVLLARKDWCEGCDVHLSECKMRPDPHARWP